MAGRLLLSFCEFQDGTFDFYVQDPETGECAQLSGALPPGHAAQRDFLERVAPPCVMTEYVLLAPPPPRR